MNMKNHGFIYSYENGLVFSVLFPGGTKVQWECIGGEEKGTKGEGPAQIIDLGHDRNFLHWIESDGLTVTQVIDHAVHNVTTSLVFPHGFDGKGSVQSLVLQGTIRKTE